MEKYHSVVKELINLCLQHCLLLDRCARVRCRIYAYAPHHSATGGELRCSFTRGFRQPGVAVLLDGLWSWSGIWGEEEALFWQGSDASWSAWGTLHPCRAQASRKGADFQPVPVAWLLPPQKLSKTKGIQPQKQPTLHVLQYCQILRAETWIACKQCRESKAETGGRVFHQMSCCRELHKLLSWYHHGAFNL